MPVRLSTREAGFEEGFRRLVEATRHTEADVDAVVAAIVDDVSRRGDMALIDYTRRFDGVELAVAGLRLQHDEVPRALLQLRPRP
jgi:histidinol dehydrogenase